MDINTDNVYGSCGSNGGGSVSVVKGKLLAFVGASEVSAIVAMCGRR